MALVTWSGGRVRKQDVIVAKNYLNEDEIDSLNRLVVIFLEQAELRIKNRKQLTLDYWRNNVDKMLDFNERPILDGAGTISHESMKAIVHKRYDSFDTKCKKAEKEHAEAEDLKQLEELSKKLESSKN
jgi:hypothetical protein